MNDRTCDMIGYESRVGIWRQLIDYIKPVGDIWVTTRGAMASHWLETS